MYNGQPKVRHVPKNFRLSDMGDDEPTDYFFAVLSMYKIRVRSNRHICTFLDCLNIFVPGQRILDFRDTRLSNKYSFNFFSYVADWCKFCTGDLPGTNFFLATCQVQNIISDRYRFCTGLFTSYQGCSA